MGNVLKKFQSIRSAKCVNNMNHNAFLVENSSEKIIYTNYSYDPFLKLPCNVLVLVLSSDHPANSSKRPEVLSCAGLNLGQT